MHIRPSALIELVAALKARIGSFFALAFGCTLALTALGAGFPFAGAAFAAVLFLTATFGFTADFALAATFT
jgi:hypothetical protein